jgi:GR25 family glycosyltransferase involved in LPS biosynthesis
MLIIMASNGLNKFDILYYINLNRRPERNEQMKNELKKTNIDPSKINRVTATDVPECGAYGCTMSHIDVLTRFLATDDSIQTCVVLEDDFGFVQDQRQVNSSIDKFLHDFNDKWDVLLLALNLIYGEKTEFPYAIRVFRSFTTAGYVVTKKFAPQLLENFKESAGLLKHEGKYVPTLCLDNYMGRLQQKTNWFSIVPRIGLQLPSYSDIEYRYVNYQC